MLLNPLLGALAGVSFLLTLWQWWVARRFPLHQRNAPRPRAAPAPPITLLKPLHGCDPHTAACLRSWFTQDYAGEIQILFGVADAHDPAGAVVRQLLAEFPQCDARLIVCPERLGANPKASKLAQLEPHAKHELLIVSDADVLAPTDLAANLVAPLGEAGVGLACCLYQLANPTTLALRWEAVATNADFWSQVLQRRALGPLDFALGAALATRRARLAEIGGFRALVDCLADDYQLGHRLARLGSRVELCPVVVACWSAPLTWRQVWRHQLRWARTIRVCQPLPYFCSLVSNATLWPVLWFVAQPSRAVLALSLVCLATRMLAARGLQQRLTRARPAAGDWWLVPVKDLLQVALWAGAFLGNRLDWRGEPFRLRQDGTLARL